MYGKYPRFIQTCESLCYDPNCVFNYLCILNPSSDLCKSTTSPFVLKIIWFCSIVMDDKGIFHVCIIVFIPQGNRTKETTVPED